MYLAVAVYQREAVLELRPGLAPDIEEPRAARRVVNDSAQGVLRRVEFVAQMLGVVAFVAHAADQDFAGALQRVERLVEQRRAVERLVGKAKAHVNDRRFVLGFGVLENVVHRVDHVGAGKVGGNENQFAFGRDTAAGAAGSQARAARYAGHVRAVRHLRGRGVYRVEFQRLLAGEFHAVVVAFGRRAAVLLLVPDAGQAQRFARVVVKGNVAVVKPEVDNADHDALAFVSAVEALAQVNGVDVDAFGGAGFFQRRLGGARPLEVPQPGGFYDFGEAGSGHARRQDIARAGARPQAQARQRRDVGVVFEQQQRVEPVFAPAKLQAVARDDRIGENRRRFGRRPRREVLREKTRFGRQACLLRGGAQAKDAGKEQEEGNAKPFHHLLNLICSFYWKGRRPAAACPAA